MSDVNQRRGRILNIEAKAEVQMVLAEIPTSEMASSYRSAFHDTRTRLVQHQIHSL